MTATERNRIAWMDIARGIGILLVIYGHCMRDDMRRLNLLVDYTHRFVYIFHMPFFFWLSGYTYQMGRTVFHKTYTRSFLFKKAKRLLAPWALYSALIYCVFSVAMSVAPLASILQNAGFEKLSPLAYCLDSLRAVNNCAIHLWYIYSLFLITAIVFVLEKLTPEKSRNTVYLITASVCFLGLLALNALPPAQRPRLPSVFCRYIPFYLLGIVMQGKDERFKGVKLWYALGVVYLLIRTACSDFQHGIKVAFLPSRMVIEYGAYVFLPGVFLLLRELSMRIADARPSACSNALRRLGKDSLYYYLFHQPFCCAFAGQLLFNKLGLPLGLVMAICMALSIVVPMALIAVGRKLHALFDRKRVALKG